MLPPRSTNATPRSGQVQRLLRGALDEVHFVKVCRAAGLFAFSGARGTAQGLRAFGRWGPLGSVVAISAIAHGDRVALVDERGTLSFAELDRRANALANAWRARGLRAGDGVAILARNHRGFLDATFACAKVGARAIYLNTDFAGPQIRDVATREGMQMLVHDDEYTGMLAGLEPALGRWRAWTDGDSPDTLEALIAGGDPSPPPKPRRRSSVVLLTSGTTGTPKGAPRAQPRSLGPAGMILSKIPFRGGDATVVCAPLFHGLGFMNAVLAVGMGATLVLRRKFDPKLVLADLARHQASALVVVPIMLARILDELPNVHDADLGALRVVLVAGAQLGGELCTRAIAALGPVVYNLYGSTEVACATIATPEDLAAAPSSVGRPPRGAVVRILDPAGREVPAGAKGRIFVGNVTAFAGYTGGGTKEVVGGLMSTGDVGYIDEGGRLHVDGRDDEMIVSGGENVFPREIEELLEGHPDVVEVAALGVSDAQFGQRLRVFVVRKPGSTLNEESVKDHVRQNLARYKTPRDVVFLDELPRNPTGKVLKKLLDAT